MTDQESSTERIEESPPLRDWVDFLQAEPPGSIVRVTGASKQDGRGAHRLFAPELQLFCPTDSCNAYMFFSSKDDNPWVQKGEWKFTYLTYYCRNCRKSSKTFAIGYRLVEAPSIGEGYKFGELPHFGPPVPPRALRLIQPDRELFLSGRRCENQRLGIGAFTYYRRVVENQWSRLVGEIIKVAKTINAPAETISALEAAKNEQQFSKAVKGLKVAIPPALLINGHNPLVLLHGALSQGVHNLPEEECLKLASGIRVVLVELAEKLGQALKDEKELTDAITKLLQVQVPKNTRKTEPNKDIEPAE